MWPFDREKQAKAVGFGDILTGLQNAISQVQGMLQNSQLENLSNFWRGDGQPVSQPVQINGEKVDIPLLTLVPHNQLAMDTVTVKFSTRIDAIAAQKSNDLMKTGNAANDVSSSPGFLSHADIQVAMDDVKSEGGDIMQVAITFKVKETPEAVSRLVDEYNKSI